MDDESQRPAASARAAPARQPAVANSNAARHDHPRHRRRGSSERQAHADIAPLLPDDIGHQAEHAENGQGHRGRGAAADERGPMSRLVERITHQGAERGRLNQHFLQKSIERAASVSARIARFLRKECARRQPQNDELLPGSAAW